MRTEDAPPAGPRPWVVLASLALLCGIWGSTYLVIRESLHDLPPFLSAGVRFTVAGSVLALVAPRLARREGGAPPTPGLVLVMGVFNVGACYGLVYWSETLLPSGLVSVLWSVFPLFMALSGHLFLPDERLAPRQGLGFLAGFAGVVLLFVTDLRAIGPEALPAGALLLLSPLSTTVGNTVVKRRGAGTSSLLLNRGGMLTGAAILLLLSLAFEREASVEWSRRAVLSVAYLAVVGTCVTFGIYFWLLRYAAATRMSLIAYVIPVVALSLGALVAGEPLRATTVAGSATVLAGVALVHAGRRPAPESLAPGGRRRRA